MIELLDHKEYINLKSKGLTNVQISKLYGKRCPAAYGSLLSNCKWISKNHLVYKGVEFSIDLFDSIPSYSEIARKHKIDRTMVYYIGRLLGIKINRSESCKFNHRKGKPVFTERERQIIMGSLLGDATIDKSNQFRVTHSDAQIPYTRWLYENLKNICTTPPVEGIKKTPEKNYVFHRISSYVTDEMECLRDLFYPDGVKIVPNIIEDLSELGLAVWYMDDGGTHWYKTKSGNSGVARIFSMGFSETDHNLLVYLFQKHGIKARIRKHNSGTKKFLTFSVEESKKLFEIMEPHFCPEMLYKVKYNAK